ncbi:tannase-domain-containing protein [Karstenula rhodostoma CBS 690.94]|uniref:Carboxylic ester hydrolase n=1 Tax=Karstenula rhodostoma CBS 690.94 TaxID=1392251 RepID=A0A9P4P7R4_9PLEO|nr:tannase-domain-containing protein [Karstenula rhodostoma CBS 690.94]
MLSKKALAWLVALPAVKGQDQLEPENVPSFVPVCETVTFSPPSLGVGVTIRSIGAEIQRNYTTHGGEHGISDIDGLNFCQVKVHLNHKGSDDDVLVEVWLPLSRDDWNDRFQGTGGAGMSTGMLGAALGPAVKGGYAASSTDGGHPIQETDDTTWVLKEDGTIDWNLLTNFATRSLVESVVVGKSMTEQFYNEKPKYSYWNGCSQGGRQGYMLAQQYPHLLDGILANAPAISLTHLAMADFWPQLVMKEEGLWMSSCEFNYFRQKAMESCDMIDGVSDGVISEPDLCDFDPLHLIGQVFYCGDKPVEVSRAMANIVRRIQEGPRTPVKTSLWYGLKHGTSFDVLASTTITNEGLRTPNPFPISTGFIQSFLLKDVSFNATRLNYADYTALWAQGNSEFGWLLDADKPDLASLQASGTKLLTWHGISDPVIPYQSTVQYRKRVELLMGGANEVDKFYRLFLAPGAEHCAGGNGPVPTDPLAALIEWVEDGKPPETLEAETTTYEGDRVTRELCAWPGIARYMGIADPKRASSWSCHGGTERPEEDVAEDEDNIRSGRAGQILDGLKDRLEGLGMGFTIG